MSLCCVICGMWFPAIGSDRLDICTDCYLQNFAGSQPPLDPGAPRNPPRLDVSAREALEAFVDNAHQLTPRQVQAMRRMAIRWQEDEAC